jgi:hypothetical protein
VTHGIAHDYNTQQTHRSAISIRQENNNSPAIPGSS